MAALQDALFETRLPLPGRRQGKVRDLYELPAEVEVPGLHPDPATPRILMVASDRVSAFDVVMPTPIPGKGRCLTAISLAWFRALRAAGVVRDHLLSTEVPLIPGLPEAERERLEGRVMVCRAARVVPIECVVRGHLAGSGWSEYQRSGSICGVALPPGLRRADRLPEPIFTPATKAVEGHDENVTFEAACAAVGGETMERLRETSLAIYREAARRAAACGLILADTKFEFGTVAGPGGRPELILVDEVLTPDSSRYWPADRWSPGREQESFDKQYLRDWLLREEAAGRWNRQPPGPHLPADVVEQTIARYQEAAKRLGGV